MLCKTSVARNVLLELDRNDVPVDLVRMYTFDSLKVFRINASACLLYIKMSTDDSKYRNCEVYDINYPDHVCETISFKNGRLCSVKEDVPDLEGKCCFEWRQGVKHDCARLMELEKTGESCYRNKNKETVELEDALIYPLIKSSSFKTPVIHDRFKKYVLVTQKKPREETEYIKELAPQTWKYLNDRKTVFDSRKSSIYTGAPAFSMFGVGEYSFAKYKVGVSGFYKKPLFSLLYSEKPVMVDDTSYFLPFDNYADAYTCMLMLNSEKVQKFLLSISFPDAKRPFTKKVLQRIDLKKCAENISFEELVKTEKRLNLPGSITAGMYDAFSGHILEQNRTMIFS